METRTRQVQDAGLFDMPPDFVLSDGIRKETRLIRIGDLGHRFRIPLPPAPSAVEIDPDGQVLKPLSVPD